MKILLVSNSFTTKDSLEYLFRDMFKNLSIVKSSTLKEYSVSQIITYNFIFIEADGYSYEDLEQLYQLKNIAPELKIMVLDRFKSERNFRIVVDNSVDAYISNMNDKQEFMYNVRKVMSGKKVYESELIHTLVNNNELDGIETLTKREKEVLDKIGRGLNNKSIASCLYITEYTVKKHISNIFSKLHLNSRQEAIIYVNRF